VCLLLQINQFWLHRQEVSVGIDFQIGGSRVIYVWFELSGITKSLSYELHNMVTIDLILDGFALVLLMIIEALILVNLY
jgi:hypothetical protein|tara:strand:- start:1052 stop:1288 length:237 start_codon:yes stop_codon:yes gene_type:complete